MKDTLTPIQELMLEVLAARYRLGEERWTFNRRFFAAANALGTMRLVEWKHGIVEKTILVWLTPAGKKLMLSDTYVPPILQKKQKVKK